MSVNCASYTARCRLPEKNCILDHWRNEAEQLNRELRNQLEVNSAQEAELREVTIRLEETRLAAEEKQRLLVNSEQRLNAQFENLANRIFENSGRRVDEQNRQSLNSLISPLREQLEGFKRQCRKALDRKPASATPFPMKSVICNSSMPKWRRKPLT